MQGLTSFVGFSLGDILAQKFIDKSDQVGRERERGRGEGGAQQGARQRTGSEGGRTSYMHVCMCFCLLIIQLDVKRLLKLASFGLLVHGPTGQ